jgi:hypothetical protein
VSLGAGKRTKEWSKVRDTELAQKFARLGITYCEFHYRNCTTSLFLTFAHVNRRRHFGKVGSDERSYNIRNVARACTSCHDYLDTVLGEAVGGAEIQRVIDNREGKHLSFFDDIYD